MSSFKWNTAKLNQIRNNVRLGMRDMADDIANHGKDNAPYKTGALTNSIRVEPDGQDTIYVKAGGKSKGTTVAYAAIQEYGGKAGRNHSVTIKGKRYMRRSLDEAINNLRMYFEGVVK